MIVVMSIKNDGKEHEKKEGGRKLNLGMKSVSRYDQTLESC